MVTTLAPLLASPGTVSLLPFPRCPGAQTQPWCDGKNTGFEVMEPGEDIH